MSFTGSPIRSALSTASLRWFGVAWKVWHHPISGNSVAPLLLLSVVSHCALLRRRSYYSPPYTDCYPTAWNGCAASDAIAHSALFLSGLKTTLFDRGWAGSAPE